MEGPEIQFAEAIIDNGSHGTRTVRFETGRLAKQAGGAVVAYLDEDTMLLSTTTAGKYPKEQFDFFPLTIDHALIRGIEATVQSPLIAGRAHLARIKSIVARRASIHSSVSNASGGTTACAGSVTWSSPPSRFPAWSTSVCCRSSPAP